MASPQLENGFTRTANELSEAIMQSDFSKRQSNILNFIIRMSYGCGKKYALLRYSDFELVGVYKSDIKKELDHLSASKVICSSFDDSLSMIRIGINKDYDQWRVSLIKTFQPEKWVQVLNRNLNDKVSILLTEVGEIQTEVSKIPQVENSGVSEIQTMENSGVSVLLTDIPEKINSDGNFQPPKEIRSFKENKDYVVDDQYKTPLSHQTEVEKQNAAIVAAWKINFKTDITPPELDKLIDWRDNDGFPNEAVILAIEKAASAGHRFYDYIDGILRKWLANNLKTIEAIKAADEEWKAAGHSRDAPTTRSGTGNKSKVVKLNVTGTGRENTDPISITSLIRS